MKRTKERKYEILDQEHGGIILQEHVRKKLGRVGHLDSTYNQTVRELLKHCEKCQEFWENRT